MTSSGVWLFWALTAPVRAWSAPGPDAEAGALLEAGVADPLVRRRHDFAVDEGDEPVLAHRQKLAEPPGALGVAHRAEPDGDPARRVGRPEGLDARAVVAARGGEEHKQEEGRSPHTLTARGSWWTRTVVRSRL